MNYVELGRKVGSMFINFPLTKEEVQRYNDVIKELENRIIKGLISLHGPWRDNQCKEALEAEPKTIRIKRYNKFKLPESNKRNDIKPLTLDLDFIKRLEEDK